MAERDATSATAALVHELQRVDRLNRERVDNPILAGALDRLADWQARRLRMTYDDLASDPRYAGAIAFFQNDLYGSADYSRRDADLLRIVPMLVRTVPEGVLIATTLAMELNALSQELDRVLLGWLPRAQGDITVQDYCRAYRRAANFPQRRRQVTLIGEVGAALDRYVGRAVVRTALAMMRQPARLAGFSALQDFLERGFAAFRAMRGATEFLAIVDQRESEILEVIVAGSSTPFPDPLAFRPTPPARGAS